MTTTPDKQWFDAQAPATPPEVTPQTIKGERLFSLAMDVVKGECGEFTYLLQEDNFYVYEDGYWKIIPSLKLLGILQEGLIREIKVKLGDNNYAMQKGKILTKYTPARKKQIIDHLKILLLKELDEFNTHPLINFENGMFDPLGINLLKHEPKYLSTIRIPYKYDPLAKCELWIKVLMDIFEGDNDKMQALQEFFGYCLSSDNEQKKGMLLLGETNTGKSTIIDIFRELIGEMNCSNVPLQYLSNPQYTPLLINKMVNIDPEVNKEAINYEREFKILTGGKKERVSCNQKHIPTFEFTPRCKIILSANIFPRITDHSSAFYQRLLLIPCNRQFSDEEMDRNLDDKLRVELSGIFNWVLEGYHRLNKRRRFQQYDFMREAVDELEDENNPCNLFFREHIEVDLSEGTYIEKSELFRKFIDWCVKYEQKRLSHITFSRSLIKKFSKYVDKDSRLTGNGARIWRNIRYVDNKNMQPVKQEINWQDGPAADNITDNVKAVNTVKISTGQSDINWET